MNLKKIYGIEDVMGAVSIYFSISFVYVIG